MDFTAVRDVLKAIPILPEAGDEFLEFRLIQQLGRGSFGKVYLARQGKLADRPVVLKISPRVDGEPRVLAQLQHTNIVPIYSIHRAERLQAVCMPYYGPTTLKEVYEDLESQGAIPQSGLGLVSTLYHRLVPRDARAEVRPGGGCAEEGSAVGMSAAAREAEWPQSPGTAETLKYLGGLTYVQAVLWVVARLASGLAHAHERGILHLDLKPGNILLTDEGQPMLLDFNLALDLKLPSSLGKGVGGTLLYMSPEQLAAFRGDGRRLDGRSDIYSLGLILFELLTARQPFELPKDPVEDLGAFLVAARRRPPPAVRRWNPAVSPAVEAIVQHCLEPEPNRRYSTARQLQEDIERHLGHYPLRHAREASVRERVGKWMRRHPTASSTTSLAVLAFAVLVLLGSASWLIVWDARVARARVQYLEFRKAFEQGQLLLNTAHSGPRDSLRRGVRLAVRALDPYVAGRSGEWSASPLVRDLPGVERTALAGEVTELLLLEVRARVALAARGGSAAEHERACRRGLERLELIPRILPRPPAAFHRDRARLLAAIGQSAAAGVETELARANPFRTSQDDYLLGTALLAEGRPDRAEILLSRAVARDSRSYWAWFALGLCHSDQGRPGDAASEFGTCTALAPGLAWPHLNRGLALARCGRLREALAAYNCSLELDPRLVEARVDRGLTYLELGDPEPALQDLAAAMAQGIRTPAVRAAHAEALSRLDRPDEAERGFAAAIRDHPGDPLPRVARGFARLGRDQDAAAADFARALELDPRYPRAHLGQAHLARHRDPRAALHSLGKALAADPDLGDALQLRALIRARLNDLRAEADVERFLRVTTPQRLYNASCVFAILAGRRRDPRLKERALEFLRRALDAGLSPEYPAGDPDLEPLRGSPHFDSLIAAARSGPADGR